MIVIDCESEVSNHEANPLQERFPVDSRNLAIGYCPDQPLLLIKVERRLLTISQIVGSDTSQRFFVA